MCVCVCVCIYILCCSITADDPFVVMFETGRMRYVHYTFVVIPVVSVETRIICLYVLVY